MAKEITSKWEDIDPDTAMRYLESMDGNRHVRQSRIDYLAAQMKAGLWRPIPQGISFDTNGHLIDGQHRMWAIIESQTTVRIYVSRNVNPEDVVAYDTGTPRGYADIAHYCGWNSDPTTASIAKVLVLGIGMRARAIPSDRLQDWYKHYQSGIDFAVALRLSSRPAAGKSMTVPMASAFARAYYCVKADALTRMGEILKTGQIEFDADRAAFVLRDAWLTGRIGKTASEQYHKTEGAIRAFNERRPIRTLQQPESELFEVPKLPVALKLALVNSSRSLRSSAAARARLFATAEA